MVKFPVVKVILVLVMEFPITVKRLYTGIIYMYDVAHTRYI